MAAENQNALTNAFLRAAYEGNVEAVLQMIEKENVPVDITNQSGLQALHFAAKTANVELADELIKKGASVNAVSQKGNAPLHVAALMGHTEIVKLMLRRGADVNLISECYGDMYTPLYMAAQIGNQEIVMLLLAHGADPTLSTKNGSTPRDVARQQGYTVVAELLREYERRTRRSKRLSMLEVAGALDEALAAQIDSDSSSDETNEEDGTPKNKKLGAPPIVQDVTSSPKNSPKHMPKNNSNIQNGSHT